MVLKNAFTSGSKFRTGYGIFAKNLRLLNAAEMAPSSQGALGQLEYLPVLLFDAVR